MTNIQGRKANQELSARAETMPPEDGQDLEHERMILTTLRRARMLLFSQASCKTDVTSYSLSRRTLS